ncbi:hypothetical protein GLOIN_2v1782606 [Rhizophagus clarus]|uniref:Uncharacterized protein n=1 Tax=Rhizophagus clarus TaxID=94130 RepID=A0A8H3QQ33_9GLOM|nr:hypothetical protein GLOIN_2v1782606 [Rhizophagus clarus]
MTEQSSLSEFLSSDAPAPYGLKASDVGQYIYKIRDDTNSADKSIYCERLVDLQFRDLHGLINFDLAYTIPKGVCSAPSAKFSYILTAVIKVAMEIKDPVELNKPYFKCELPLEQDLDSLAISFSRTSAQLLEKISAHSQLKKKYRLEVEFDHCDWVAKFQICLDPLSWFDVYLRPKGNEQAVNIAQEYIKSIKDKFPPKSTTDEEHGDPITTQKYNAFEICGNYREGICGNRNCKRPHPEFIYRTFVNFSDIRAGPCGQYIPNSLRINNLTVESTTKKYSVCLRRDLYRELLLIPYEHDDNEKLVTSVDTWKNIFKLHRRLGFYQVSFNFGVWESLSCHGHAHFRFDANAWDVLEKESVSWEEVDKEVSARLKEYKHPGPNYLLQNCLDLEDSPQLLKCRIKIQEDRKLINNENALDEWREGIRREIEMDGNESHDDLIKILTVRKSS